VASRGKADIKSKPGIPISSNSYSAVRADMKARLARAHALQPRESDPDTIFGESPDMVGAAGQVDANPEDCDCGTSPIVVLGNLLITNKNVAPKVINFLTDNPLDDEDIAESHVNFTRAAAMMKKSVKALLASPHDDATTSPISSAFVLSCVCDAVYPAVDSQVIDVFRNILLWLTEMEGRTVATLCQQLQAMPSKLKDVLSSVCPDVTRVKLVLSLRTSYFAGCLRIAAANESLGDDITDPLKVVADFVANFLDEITNVDTSCDDKGR
jgi:hypothetical protein